MVPNALASKGRVRVFWWLMVAGIGSWFLYQLSWNYFELYRHQEVPELFVGDIVLFLHLVPMIAALAMQPHQQHDNRDVRLGSARLRSLVCVVDLPLSIYCYSVAVRPSGSGQL
jgi:hypothetical protein